MHPPDSEEFESTAVTWLLDVVPPDYRLHGVLRRYPVALAAMARYHAKACVEGAREGYRTARTELTGVLPPHAIDTVLAAYRKEGARLATLAVCTRSSCQHSRWSNSYSRIGQRVPSCPAYPIMLTRPTDYPRPDPSRILASARPTPTPKSRRPPGAVCRWLPPTGSTPRESCPPR